MMYRIELSRPVSMPLRSDEIRLPKAQEILLVAVGVSKVILNPDLEGRQCDLFRKPPGSHAHHTHIRHLARLATFLGGSLSEEIDLVRT